jgi:hypothetical protein
MSAVRSNDNSSESVVDIIAPFAQGTFRVVYKGKYVNGSRKGQSCVSKVFKESSAFEEDFFRLDLLAVDKCLELVEKWNECKFIDKIVKVNSPEIWQFRQSGTPSLVEPWIENWEKFNSNTGWFNNKTDWHLVMQSLSHFTYFISSGQFLLCDLQGGIYQDCVVISDPVIHSMNRKFGVTDLGREGILTFFARHKCNNYCSINWAKPKYCKEYFYLNQSTTLMELGRNAPHISTREDRNCSTQKQQQQHYYDDSHDENM